MSRTDRFLIAMLAGSVVYDLWGWLGPRKCPICEQRAGRRHTCDWKGAGQS